MINAKITGAREILKRLQRVTNDIDDIEKESVYLTANLIKNTAVKSIQAVSMGTFVQRQKQGGKGTYTHIASKPDSAPNTDTGNLVKSISVQPLQPRKIMTVGVNAKYAEALEFGTRKMDARPFMQPSIEDNKDALEKLLANKLRALLA